MEFASRPLFLAATLAGLSLAPSWAGAATVETVVGNRSTFEIIFSDPAGDGFNDEASSALPGQIGNPGTTLGGQRREAMKEAARIWADLLPSTVHIQVSATLDPDTDCNASGGVLAAAGFTTFHKDWVAGNAPPFADTWYPQALANSFAGVDLAPADEDIDATFNVLVGTAGCLPSNGWYYGLDATPGSGIDFVTVALHELGHGLGFATLVDLSTGAKALGLDDVYMRFLEDHSADLLWPVMTNAQRAASAHDSGDLHWVGPSVLSSSGTLTAGTGPNGHVKMYAPNPIEPGSSVSHFSTALQPDEIMQPFLMGANHNVGLAGRLLEDIGWTVPCGNGILDVGEECDSALPDPPNGTCTLGCTICGNGEAAPPEACDDGNSENSDACKNDCSLNTCTDGYLYVGVEACDDGDANDFDGCTNACTVCGDAIVTAPEDCDDGNLLNGDGCPSNCNTGQLPPLDYGAAPGIEDGWSLACQKQAAAGARGFQAKKLGWMRACLDKIQLVKATTAAGLDATNAIAAAKEKCVEPWSTAPNSRTMLGHIAAAQARAISSIETKCGTPGQTTLNGRSIGFSASGDFNRDEIRGHIVRVGCEVEAAIADGYNEAASDLGTFTARSSQGGQTLDRSFPCLAVGPPALPNPVSYSPPSSAAPDTSSTDCQLEIGKQMQKFAQLKYGLLRTCLGAVQNLKATEQALLDTAAATAATVQACVEPSPTALDARTMIGKIRKARVLAISAIETKCGTPGATTLSGTLVDTLASGDFGQSELVAYMDKVGCNIEKLTAVAYHDAISDLSRFNRRPSQGGGSLDQEFPSLAPGTCPP